ncbi:hypothetical protein [Shimia sp. W99]
MKLIGDPAPVWVHPRCLGRGRLYESLLNTQADDAALTVEINGIDGRPGKGLPDWRNARICGDLPGGLLLYLPVIIDYFPYMAVKSI